MSFANFYDEGHPEEGGKVTGRIFGGGVVPDTVFLEIEETAGLACAMMTFKQARDLGRALIQAVEEMEN